MTGVHCIEHYLIDGREYGIEDHEDGRRKEDHFFPERFKRGERGRFNVWVGGCGIGHYTTLEEARARVLEHAGATLKARIEAAHDTLASAYEATAALAGGLVATWL